MIRTLCALVATTALLAGCSDGAGRRGDPTPEASGAATLTVRVSDPALTEDVAKVIDGRLHSFGVDARGDDITEPGVVTFALPRRLDDAEMAALQVRGRLAFRPVVEAFPPTGLPGVDCTSREGRDAAARKDTDDTKPATACDREGAEAYRLGPAELTGRDVRSAGTRVPVPPHTLDWTVALTFADATRWADVTERLVSRRLAIVLDGLVYSAPTIQERIPDGSATITGSFDERTARNLAAVLNGGALPLTVSVTQA